MKLVEEAIRLVQIGTDKTAAELAIPRLEKELKDAKQALSEVKAGPAGPLVAFFGILLAGAAGFAVGGEQGRLLFLVLVGCAIAAGGYALKATFPDTTAERTRLAEIEERLRNAKNIADG